MNILNIAPNAPYNDNWGYQENILPKYQKKLGHTVGLIITTLCHKDGKIDELDECKYFSNDGVMIIRKKHKKFACKKITRFISKMDIINDLIEFSPDLIFYHGLISTTIFDVLKYKRKYNNDVVIVQDNHHDYNIGFPTRGILGKVIHTYFILLNRYSQKYVSKVYGVTPWRKSYVENYYRISKKITDVLIMGADDDKLIFENREENKYSIRKELGITPDKFVVISGGKLDGNKKIIELMQACSNKDIIKLVIFGNVLEDIKKEFYEILSCSTNIVYVGWIPADKIYNYFFAANLCCFPGQHSVLWEQACASKTPCAFAKWEGMEHVDNGGNSVFITDNTVNGIWSSIEKLIFTNDYFDMCRKANSSITDIYLYSNIAQKSLECLYDKTDTTTK